MNTAIGYLDGRRLRRSLLAAAVGFTGLLASLVVLLVTAFLMPVVALAALALGLSDTLVDWRLRLARAAHNSRGQP